MKFKSSDYDKIINILNRNPSATYKVIASHLNCSEIEICNLFKELRKEYHTEEAIEQFLETNTTNKDPILFIDGVLESLIRPDIDQSYNLAVVFDEIAAFYEEMESVKDEEIKYSEIYYYFSALILNHKLPILDQNQQAIVLSLMFEILNFSDEMVARKPNVFKDFIEKIHTQLAQFLIKVSISPEEWNEENNRNLFKVFNIPKITAEEIKADPILANKKIQKAVSLYSLNPFHLSPESILPFQELLDEIITEDNPIYRNLKMYNDKLGIDIDCIPVVADVNNGDKVIVHHKHVEKISRSNAGKPMRTEEEMEIENQIYEMIGKHDIINVSEYKKSLTNNEEPEVKKMKIFE